MKHSWKAAAFGVLAVLFVSPESSAQQLSGARVVTACGATAPFPTPHVGSTFSLTVDNTGTLCSVGGGSGGGNASVGPNGSAVPADSTQIGFANSGGNLTNVSAANPLPTTGSGFTVSHGASTALVTALSAKTSAGSLTGYNCSGVTGGAAGFCVAVNQASTPATGTITSGTVLDFCEFDTTARGCSLGRAPSKVAYSAGIQILVTTAASPYTYTTGTATAAISADFQ